MKAANVAGSRKGSKAFSTYCIWGFKFQTRHLGGKRRTADTTTLLKSVNGMQRAAVAILDLDRKDKEGAVVDRPTHWHAGAGVIRQFGSDGSVVATLKRVSESL